MQPSTAKPPMKMKQINHTDNDNDSSQEHDSSSPSKQTSNGVSSGKGMSFELNKAADISKNYLKKEMTSPYLGKLGSEMGEQLVEFVQDWAEKNNAKIDLSVKGVNSETPIYTGLGAAAGAGLGYAFGGKVGSAIGLLFGAAIGTAASCVSVKFHTIVEGTTSAPVVH